MPAASLYSPIEFVKKNPNTVQALTNATVRALLWMQDASPQQILATVPEEYTLGNKAMYLFAYNNVKTAYSKDGLFSEAGAKTTLKALASFNPEIKPDPRSTSPRPTPTSSSRRRSPSTARRSRRAGCRRAAPALALEQISVTFVSDGSGALHGDPDATPDGAARGIRLGGRSHRLRQIHAAERRGRPACAVGGRRARERRAAGGAEPQGGLPVPDRGAAALAHGARQRHRRPGVPRRGARRGASRGRRPGSRASGCAAMATAIRTSSPAACASAWRWRRR